MSSRTTRISGLPSGVGAGVVADSVPAMEAAETVHKAGAVLAAIAAAQGAALVIDSAPGAPRADAATAGREA